MSMKNFILVMACFFLASIGRAEDNVYTIKNFKAGLKTVSEVVNGTAGAGYLEFDHQSANTGTPGTASNDVRVFAKSKKLYTSIDDGAGTPIITEVGSGAAGSGINYIESPDFETAGNGTLPAGWALYEDAAGLSPVDGTGVATSNEITFLASTTTPLRGLVSAVITKDAANRQGEGASFDFAIDDADFAKVMTIEFSYSVGGTFDYGSGTAADPSDVVVYLYDKDNSVLIQPDVFYLNGSGSYTGQFQTAASPGDEYRLILHVATTNAAAWTMKVEGVTLGPKSTVRGPVETDWVTFTPTTPSNLNGNGSEIAGRWRRVGDSAEYNISWKMVGAGAAGDVVITLPNTIDVNKLSHGAGAWNTGNINYGYGYWYDTGTATKNLGFSYATTTTLYITTDAAIATLSGASLANGDYLNLMIRTPILGWGSNTVVSSTNDGRQVVAKYYESSATTAVSTAAIFDFDTKLIDTHGAVSTGPSWSFTCPIAGYYFIDAAMMMNDAAWAAGEFANIRIYTDGTLTTFDQEMIETAGDRTFTLHTSTAAWLNAGHIVRIYAESSGGAASALGGSRHESYISIHSLNVGQQIAASEVVVVAAYQTTAVTDRKSVV